jgi:hypothetical protein
LNVLGNNVDISSSNRDTSSSPLLDVLDEFGRSISNQDLDAALATFSLRPDVLLVGSEAGEVAKGPEALRSFLELVLNSGSRITWQWSTRHGAIFGDAGYVFAEGEVIVTSATATSRQPYRMTGILVREGTEWRLLCFHGAEPV